MKMTNISDLKYVKKNINNLLIFMVFCLEKLKNDIDMISLNTCVHLFHQNVWMNFSQK